VWLILFSVFVSVVEAIGISAIMPFIDIATNFDNIHSNQYYQKAFIFFAFDDDVNFAIVFGILLFGFYLFRGGINFMYSYATANFQENLYAQITKRLFETYLAMPYQVFTNKNSSYLIKAIITEASLIPMVVGSVLLIISEIFVVIFLYILMLFVNWKITLIFTVVMIFKMIFLSKTISKKIKAIGAIREKVQARYYEMANRLFGNFKQVKLQNSSVLNGVMNDFSLSVDKYAKVNAINTFLSVFPRLFLETSGFSLIVLLLIVLLYLNQSNISYILPALSLFVLSLYRLLPSVNRIVNSYNTIMYFHKSIDIIDNELKTTQEDLASNTLKFQEKIELIKIDFAYRGRMILENINLTISKGDKIAFIGESGSGKSTLVDLIIGLYAPSKGEIRADGVILDESNLQYWRSQVGYIPQQVYLFDGTILENVCFGRKVDQKLLEKTLKQADIFDFLQTKQGVKTLVGEDGIQLSGGQKQRIAIARALYGDPAILVLDEATSALDEETEKKVMNEIYKISKDKTLIIIAHRLSTIKGCDKVYQLEDGDLNIQ